MFGLPFRAAAPSARRPRTHPPRLSRRYDRKRDANNSCRTFVRFVAFRSCSPRIHGLTPVATTYRPFGTNVLVTRRVSEGEAVSVVPFAYASVTFVLYSAGLKGCMVGWRLSWGGCLVTQRVLSRSNIPKQE